MSTHPAVVTVSPRTPLEIHHLPTPTPADGEVCVRSEWTASTPFDLHQADGGLGSKHPDVLGDGIAGTVVEVGSEASGRLKIGDKVFGFVFQSSQQKAHQEFAIVPENMLGLLPEGVEMHEAVTVPDPLVTTFHAITTDLRLPLPWPKPEGFVPKAVDAPILIWGGSSSVGQFALQVLRYYEYRNLSATSSRGNHELLTTHGAKEVFDYNDHDVVDRLLRSSVGRGLAEGKKAFVLDCIGSQKGSVRQIAQIAKAGTRVAILLPVIIRDASETEPPELSMTVDTAADWAKGIEVRGVRTHFYLQNKFFAEHLQSMIIPAMLAEGIIQPTKQKIVEGPTLLIRAQKAMDMLRRKEVSGGRLVWKVAE